MTIMRHKGEIIADMLFRKEKPLPPKGHCAFCERKLWVVGRTHLCRYCKAVYIKCEETGLLQYLGKIGDYAKQMKESTP